MNPYTCVLYIYNNYIYTCITYILIHVHVYCVYTHKHILMRPVSGLYPQTILLEYVGWGCSTCAY